MKRRKNIAKAVMALALIATTLINVPTNVKAATYDCDYINIYVVGDSLLSGIGNTSASDSVYSKTLSSYTRIEGETGKKCMGVGFYLNKKMNTYTKSSGTVVKSPIYDTLNKQHITSANSRNFSKGGALICGTEKGMMYDQVKKAKKKLAADKAEAESKGLKYRPVFIMDGGANDFLKKTSYCPTYCEKVTEAKEHAKKVRSYMNSLYNVDSSVRFIYIVPTHISQYAKLRTTSFDLFYKYLKQYVDASATLRGKVEFIKTADVFSNSSTSYIQSDKLHMREKAYIKLTNQILASSFLKREAMGYITTK